MAAPTPTERPGSRPIGGTYTFGGRTGRIGPMRQRALEELVPRYHLQLPLDVTPAPRRVVEIGCGKGDATAAMAAPDADAGMRVIACEANAATIANVALLLHEGGIENVRLWLGDAFALLAQLGAQSVAEIRVWFPDPWPKPRQARKRLIVAERFAVIVDALVIGGRLRLATDDPAYAEQTLAAIDAEPRLVGGIVQRPAERPITAFEARGLREGRIAIDIEAVRQPDHVRSME